MIANTGQLYTSIPKYNNPVSWIFFSFVFALKPGMEINKKCYDGLTFYFLIEKEEPFMTHSQASHFHPCVCEQWNIPVVKSYHIFEWVRKEME